MGAVGHAAVVGGNSVLGCIGPGQGGGRLARAPSSTAVYVLLIFSEISTRFIVTEWFPLPAQFGR